jgi:hypothetical protein
VSKPTLEGATKVLTFVALLAYLTGLVVVNTYLVSFGVSEFNLLRPRFVATGLLLLAVVVLATGCTCVGAWLLHYAFWPRDRLTVHHPNGFARAGLRLSGVGNAALFLVVPYVCFRLLLVQDHEGATLLYVGAALVGWLLILGLWFVQTRAIQQVDGTPAVETTPGDAAVEVEPEPQATGEEHAPEKPAAQEGWMVVRARLLRLLTPRPNRDLPLAVGLAMVAVFLIPYLYLTVLFFVEGVYPRVPEQFGGGQPQTVQLLLDKDAVAGLRTLGVNIAPGVTTAEVELLLTTDSYYLIRDAGEIYSVDEALVQAVRRR